MSKTIKRTINTIDQWESLKTELIQKGYKLWQMQYSYDSPEGLHVWFLKKDNQVEVVTHVKEIQKDIVSSGMN